MNMFRSLRTKTAKQCTVYVLMVTLMIVGPLMILPGCGGNDFLGLEDYQRDILLGALSVIML